MKFEELSKNVPPMPKGSKELSDAIGKKYKYSMLDVNEKKVNLDVYRRVTEDPFFKIPTPMVTSGDILLDITLGGGWGIGRIHKLSGLYSSGKSSELVAVMAYVTRAMKKFCFIMETENGYTKEWLMDKGVDINYVFIGRAENAEMALDILEAVYESDVFPFIFFDGIATVASIEQMDKTFDQSSMAKMASLFTRFTQKVLTRLNKKILEGSGSEDLPTVFYTNQIRENPNARFNKEYTPGGKAQDHAATTAIKNYKRALITHSGASVDDEKEPSVGMDIQVKVEKNKLFPPLKDVTIGLLNEAFRGHPKHSFYHARSIYRVSKALGLAELNGAWFSIPKLNIKMQGEDKFFTEIATNKKVRKYLVDEIKKSLPFDLKYPYDYMEICSPIEYAASGLDTLLSKVEEISQVNQLEDLEELTLPNAMEALGSSDLEEITKKVEKKKGKK